MRSPQDWLGGLPAGKGQPTLEERLFLAVTLLGGLVAIFVVFPANALQGLPWATSWSAIAFGFLTLGIHLAARRGHPMVVAQFLLFIAILDLLWFENAGSQGPMIMFFFVAAMCLVVFFKRNTLWAMLGLVIANVVALHLLERSHPGWAIPYPDPSTRTLDLAVTFVICCLVCVMILWMVLATYRKEQVRLESAGRAIRESERRYATTFQSIPTAIAIAEQETGRFLAANEGFTQLFGYTESEVLGRCSGDLGIWAEPGQRDDVIRRLEGGEEARHLTLRIRRKDGSLRWASYSGDLVVLDGRPCLLSTAVDITAQMAIEEARRESEERYHAVFEQAGDYVLIIEARPDEPPVIVDVNEAALEVHGYSREEMVGQPITLIDPYVSPAENRQRGESLKRGSKTLFEVRHRRKDGSTFDAEVRAIPFRIGGRERIITVERDITERKRAERALHESEAKLQEAAGMAKLGYWEVDHGSGRVTWSEGLYRIHGRLTTLEPPSWEEFQSSLHPDDRTSVIQSYEGHLRRQDVDPVPRYRIVLPTGETRHIRSQWQTEYDQAGSPLRTFGTDQDETEQVLLEVERKNSVEARLALETQLQHLQRMEGIGRLAGGISHDMNNVLAAIMSVSEVLHAKGGENLKLYDLILDATKRGRNLLKGLLDFARKEIEDAEFFDLNELVQKEAELLASTMLQRIKLDLALAPGLPRLMGSSSALSTALMNLCVNAMDAMPDGGTLALRTSRVNDQSVELMVQDTGHGMAPEVLARAMEPFYTTKPMGKGTGLGLSMVFGTIQAHGGHMDIQSQVGKGTKVRISLPVASGENPRAVPMASPSVPKGSGPLRILLVDDDFLVREGAAGVLESLGHHVTLAGSGHEAIGMTAAGEGWDLAVLDLNMPGLDGVETLIRLRQTLPDLPAIVATGYIDDQTRGRIENMGRAVILDKPYTIMEFQKTLAFPGLRVRASVAGSRAGQ